MSVAPLVARYLAEGNLMAADFACRTTLRDNAADHDVALMGLAVIAGRLGRHEHERLYLERIARPFARHFAAPELERPIVPLRRPGVAEQRPRFLIINAWGHGFWSDVSHVLGCCILAWLTGRIPVTNWRWGSLYGDAGENAFTRFFEPVSDVDLTAIGADGLSFHPPVWTAALLADPVAAPALGKAGPAYLEAMAAGYAPDVIVCDRYIAPAPVLDWVIADVTPSAATRYRLLSAFVAETLRPDRAILARVERFVTENFGERGFVALHVRGTDKSREHADADVDNDRIVAEATRVTGDAPIFLMTDDSDVAERLSRTFGERMVLAPASRTTGQYGVHNCPAASPPDGTATNRVALGVEIMVDTYIAAQARHFIGSGRSNVAAAVDLLRGDQRRSTLVSPNQLLHVEDWGTIAW